MRLRGANREQLKLLFSIGTNFLTRIPGAIGVYGSFPATFRPRHRRLHKSSRCYGAGECGGLSVWRV